MRLKIIFILIFVLFVSSCSEKILEVSPAEVDKTIKYKDKNITFKEKDDKDMTMGAICRRNYTTRKTHKAMW